MRLNPHTQPGHDSPLIQARVLKSRLVDVTDDVWTEFVYEMETQPATAISDSGGLGAFDIKPWRLVELGIATDLRRTITAPNRSLASCTFNAPLTQVAFLLNPITQYAVFTLSMVRYRADLAAKRIEHVAGLSVSGMLALLHRGGKGAVKKWPKILPHTESLLELVDGSF